MKLTFNTGRLYTTLGQVITVLTLPNENVTLFMDHSRGIGGEIEGLPPLTSPEATAGWVMVQYDGRNYKMSLDATNLDRLDTIHNVRI